MREATLTQDQTNLLSRFERIGGCVNYVIFEVDPETYDVMHNETHRLAAVNALEILGQRWKKYAIEMSAQKKMPIERFFSLKIDYDKAKNLKGRRISDWEFLGPRYDSKIKELVFPKVSSIFGGYAYAFSDPPYLLCDFANNKRISTREASDLFEEINREILGGITRQSIIMEWPVDWSNYFDAGNEWWGSFLWTFSNPGSKRLIAIAASTTD